jgi:cytoskeletal protein RodZ
MPSVGDKLRMEREKQNRLLADIATQTRISLRYLQALEKDDLSSFPGAFFYKSFLKQYCTVLGLPYEAVESAAIALVPTEEVDPLPALTAAYHAAKSSSRASRGANMRVSWAIGFLVAALVGSSGLYAWWQKLQRSAAAKETPAVVQPAPTPAPAPAPKEPAPAPPQAELQTANFIDVSATERTWVSISSDGKTIFKGVLSPAQTKYVEIAEKVRVLTRNAAGLDVRWKGKPIGPIGEHGQARLVVFTPDHFQILHAKM